MLITAAHAASSAGEPWTANPSNWVAIGFVLFLALVFFLKVHKKLGAALDGRADRIRSELEEAKRLREDAQALYAEYQRKSEEAMAQADAIVAHAREEAERMAENARKDLEASIARRRELAEAKIAQAEQSAITEVRNAAIDVAISATTSVLKEDMQGEAGKAAIDAAIGDVAQRLN